MEYLKIVLRDNTLSLHAKALYCFIETMDGSIDPYRQHLYIKESESLRESAMKELVKAGYAKQVVRNKIKCYLTIRKY